MKFFPRRNLTEKDGEGAAVLQGGKKGGTVVPGGRGDLEKKGPIKARKRH